jgi:hypothetical protein
LEGFSAMGYNEGRVMAGEAQLSVWAIGVVRGNRTSRYPFYKLQRKPVQNDVGVARQFLNPESPPVGSRRKHEGLGLLGKTQRLEDLKGSRVDTDSTIANLYFRSSLGAEL